MTEAELVAKLSQVEALFARTTFAGERDAAAHARDKLRARLAELLASDVPTEQQFSLRDIWSVRLMIALLRRYEIKPYRRKGQRRTTLMARIPQKFLDETLWPQFIQLSDTLEQYLQDVTERVIAQAIHPDGAEPPTEAKALAAAGTESEQGEQR